MNDETTSNDSSDWHPETRAIRAGRADNGGALAPILWASTTFATPTVAEARAAATGIAPSKFYARYGNPTVAAFEDAVAQLEGAEAARAFGSGMGAISSVVLGMVSKGDHVVVQRQIYGATQLLFQNVCPRFGIDVTFVDATEPGAFAAAVIPGRTTMVFAETPANPRLDLADLSELGAIAGPVTVVDSTFATPLGQRPLDFGVDLVVHSATKGIAGHNDATIGVVAGERELIDWLYSFAVIQGAVASPFDAMNALRGIRTLSVRLERQTANAEAVARFLEAHPKVAEVRWPGLESHPQFELARRQMLLPGAQLSFELAADAGGASDDPLVAGRTFVEGVEIVQFATSLGGPETLATHPASTTHVGLSPEELDATGITPRTIRMSIGLEHPDDLVADLGRALDRI